jgi:hypothetical protein
MNKYIVIALTFILAGCAPMSVHGVYRPQLITDRSQYVRDFPVNKATKQEVLDFVGAPDKTYKDGDLEYLTYSVVPQGTSLWPGASSKFEYTYVIRNNIVVDVIFINDAGIFGIERHQHSQMRK